MTDETPRVRWTRGQRDEVLSLREAKGWGPTKLSAALGVPVPQIKFWISSSSWAVKKGDKLSSFRMRFQDWEGWAASSFRTRWRTAAKEVGADLDTVPKRSEIEEWLRGLPPTCGYCLTSLTPKNFAVDHMTPTARGGGFGLDNLLQCCRRCNLAKGPMTAEEFFQLRAVVAEWADGGKSLLARLAHGFIGRQRFGGK